jgi:hypothetical protein
MFNHWFRRLFRRSWFALEIRGDAMTVAWGRAPRHFLRNCEKIIRKHPIERAYIYGIRKHNEVGLQFSPGFPPDIEDRVLKLWQTLTY